MSPAATWIVRGPRKVRGRWRVRGDLESVLMGWGAGLVGRLEELLGCVNLVEPVSAFGVSLAISTCGSLEGVGGSEGGERAKGMVEARSQNGGRGLGACCYR